MKTSFSNYGHRVYTFYKCGMLNRNKTFFSTICRCCCCNWILFQCVKLIFSVAARFVHCGDVVLICDRERATLKDTHGCTFIHTINKQPIHISENIPIHMAWLAHTHLFSFVSQYFILFSSHGDRYTFLPLHFKNSSLSLFLFLSFSASHPTKWRNVSVLSRFHLTIEKRFTNMRIPIKITAVLLTRI